jgi:hypothetical protein
MAVLPHQWPWTVRPASELPDEVQGYLADTELNALGGQVHEAVMIEPVLTTTAGVIGCLWVLVNLPPTLHRVRDFVWVVLFVFIGRLVFKYWEWTRDLIFITGKRIVAVRGIITRRVEMMPLGKLTDMSYIRTPLGMVLGYGTFRLESAGQDQALGTLTPIPDPDASYRHVQNLLFGRAIGDVRLVDITTEQKLGVKWTGTYKHNGSGTGGSIEQGDDTKKFWQT